MFVLAGCDSSGNAAEVAGIAERVSSETQTTSSSPGSSCRLPPPLDGTEESDPSEPFPYAKFDFWELHGAGTTYINYEQQPSFAQLARSADLVVAGRITTASVDHPSPENPSLSITDLPTTLVTVTDRSGESHRFSLVRINSPDCVLDQPLPRGEYVFVLNRTVKGPPATEECASVDCVLRVMPGGGVDSVLVDDPRRPSNSWFDVGKVRSVDELVALARKARR